MSILSNGFRRLSALAAALTLSLSSAAEAHPHVWIKVRTVLLVEGGALVGLHHIWVLDESWRNSQLDQHDKDNDGRLSAAELEPLAAESKTTLEMFKSFTTIRTGGARIRPGPPRDMTIENYGDLLGMSFAVRLDKPIPLAGAELLLEVYDATFFSSYSFAGPDAVSFAGETAPGCAITVGAPPSPQQANAFRMMARQLGADFGIAGKPDAPQSTAIKCGGIGGGAAAGAVSLGQ